MKYYVNRNTGKPALISDKVVNDPDLIEVPQPAGNRFQIWDGSQWTGSTATLEERYGSFRVAMLNSAAWAGIKQAFTSAVPEFMAAIAYMDDNPALVKYLWNQIIPSLNPTTDQVLEWQGIVTATEIGIQWIGDRELAFDIDDAGLML